MTSKVAVTQKPPVFLDRQKTTQCAIDSISEAAQANAELLVFPEAFLPGYPTWIWRLRPGGDMTLAAEAHARLRSNAVDIARGDLQEIQDAAARSNITVVLGLDEVDSQFSGTTLFNSVVVIGNDGRLLNRHRKLMPTNPERMVWGMGDGGGLRVVDTPIGRIGTLLCWENYMPLARFALYAQNLDIYVAPTWDCSDAWLSSMRHIAREGGCWVISTATAMQGSDVPEDFPARNKLFQTDEWINDGNAMVVAPSGQIIAGPLSRDKGVLYAEIDVEEAHRARRSLDVCGHYGRPDIFSLEINRQPQQPVTFSDRSQLPVDD